MQQNENQKEGFISKIIEWSINNKFMVIILTVAYDCRRNILYTKYSS